MDGGSTDGSVDILKDNSDIIKYWESKPDRGIAHAWNKAINHASGEWVCFLGADDFLWSEDVLERMASRLKNASSRVVYGDVFRVTDAGQPIESIASPWSRQKFVSHCLYFSHQGVFHHRDLFSEHGFYDESFDIAADYEFLLRELKNSDAQFEPDIVVSAVRLGGLSSDVQRGKYALREIEMAQKAHGFSNLWAFAWRRLKERTKRRLSLIIGGSKALHVIDWYRLVTGRRRLWTIK